MQSVGEVMAIGRTFSESLQKALRSLEQGRAGLNADPAEAPLRRPGRRRAAARGRPCPRPSGSSQLEAALRRGVGVDALAGGPGSTRGSSTSSAASSPIGWRSAGLGRRGPARRLDRRDWRRAKRLGFSDAQMAYLLGAPTRPRCGPARLAVGVRATFKTVDTCAAEFAADTPYHYSTYEDEDEVRPRDRAAR